MPRTKLNAEHRRALKLLAESPEGCTEALLMAHGFTLASMVELVRAGHVSAQTEQVRGDPLTVDVTRIRITDDGRVALAKRR